MATLTNLANQLVVPTGDAVKDEQQGRTLEHDLLQGTYADLYLQSALAGEAILRSIETSPFSPLIAQIEHLLHEKADEAVILRALDPLVDSILIDKDAWKEARELLVAALYQVEFRKSRLPLYHMLIHHIEFRSKNRELVEKQTKKQERISEIFTLAGSRLSRTEADELRLSYETVQVLSEAKDIMGEIDGQLLPYWLQLFTLVEAHIQKEQPDYTTGPIGPGGMFYELVWHLPDEYKSRVFTPDDTDYSLESL